MLKFKRQTYNNILIFGILVFFGINQFQFGETSTPSDTRLALFDANDRIIYLHTSTFRLSLNDNGWTMQRSDQNQSRPIDQSQVQPILKSYYQLLVEPSDLATFINAKRIETIFLSTERFDSVQIDIRQADSSKWLLKINQGYYSLADGTTPPWLIDFSAMTPEME